MRLAPYGASKRFCLWQKPCRRANSLRPRILICQGPQKSLLFWARAPTARAGVAGAGAVGVNGDCFHSFLLGREWFFKDLCRKGERVPPCGAGSFLTVQKGTKDPLGAASGERLRAAGAHSHCPQTPITGRRLPGRLALASGGSEHKILHPSCLGDTGPYCVKNLNASALYGYRLAGYNHGSHSARSPPHQTGRQAPGGVR